MSITVLVTYGSKYGATAEIAESVGEVLRKEGFTAEVRRAGTVRALAGYDAVVLGGALYAGRWHRDARRFARQHRKALSRMPVWLFSSGPLDDSASERDIPPAPSVARTAMRLSALGHVTFGGRLDATATGRMARAIVNSGKGGDFRDFDAVAGWASAVARDLAVRLGEGWPTGGR